MKIEDVWKLAWRALLRFLTPCVSSAFQSNRSHRKTFQHIPSQMQIWSPLTVPSYIAWIQYRPHPVLSLQQYSRNGLLQECSTQKLEPIHPLKHTSPPTPLMAVAWDVSKPSESSHPPPWTNIEHHSPKPRCQSHSLVKVVECLDFGDEFIDDISSSCCYCCSRCSCCSCASCSCCSCCYCCSCYCSCCSLVLVLVVLVVLVVVVVVVVILHLDEGTNLKPEH